MFLAGSDKVKVGVSLKVQEYFVKKIGGEFVEVYSLIPERKNPKFYEPTYKQMKRIKDLDIFVLIGTPYEKRWSQRFKNANPRLRILDLALKECQDLICYPWLSFNQVKEHAKQIAHTLRIADIKNAHNYRDNLEKFLKEIESFQEEIATSFLGKSITFATYQPIWKSFAQEFHLQNFILFDKKDAQEAKKSKLKVVYLSPFDFKKLVYPVLGEDIQVVEINPYAKDWKDNLLGFVTYLNMGALSGKE